MGRPRLSEGEALSSQIGIRLTGEELLDIDMVVFDQGFCNRSEWARFHLGEFCTKYFAEHGGQDAVVQKYKDARLLELQAELDTIMNMK